MHTTDAMPYEPSTPCAQCGRGVDPLRAPFMLVLDHGNRYFCGASCRDGYRTAEPSRRLHATRSEVAEARADEPAQVVRIETPALTRPPSPAKLPALTPLLLFPLPLAAALAFAHFAYALHAASALVVLANGIIVANARSTREETGPLVFAALPLGSALLAVAAVLGAQPSALLAAALAGGLCWLRESLTRSDEAQIGSLLDELARAVPERTRVSRTSLAAGDEPAPLRPSFTAEVRAGDHVQVEGGQIVPVDGVVVEGEAQVLGHPGASTSRKRIPGDTVLAGARVIEGTLRVAATRVGAARALFRPRSLGSDNSRSGARLSRIVRRLTATPSVAAYAFVTGVAAASFAADALHALAAFGAALAGFPALTLLRAVRVPYVAAAAKAAQRGIVFRDAASLDRAGRVVTTVLCAEGITTLGAPELVELTCVGAAQEVRELLSLSLGAELAAPLHPLSLAIQAYARDRSVDAGVVRRAAYARSRGVTGLVDGAGALALGNRQLLLSTGVSVAVADREAQRAEMQGRSVLFLALGGRARALLVLEDPPRPEARSAVQGLFDLDIDAVLISGDHRATVEAMARALDITHVKAELTTEERGAEIERLRDAGGLVAVLGRAGSDDTALAAADVSMTLDAAGGPREGDLAVASDDLREVVEGLRIAHRARRTVQNVLAVAASAAVVLSVATVLSVLPPVGAIVLALALDTWALPSTARLLPQRRRSTSATRSHGGGATRSAS